MNETYPFSYVRSLWKSIFLDKLNIHTVKHTFIHDDEVHIWEGSFDETIVLSDFPANKQSIALAKSW